MTDVLDGFLDDGRYVRDVLAIAESNADLAMDEIQCVLEGRPDGDDVQYALEIAAESLERALKRVREVQAAARD